jgi:quaternary ammonium compound-resistance protein SugE
MQWIHLILAGVLEIVWATTMKMSDGFSKLIPSVITIAGYIASAVFLSMALKKIPLGTAYAIWTGIGILGTSILGVVLFKEILNPAQMICIALIAAGIIGLKLLT